MNKIRDRKVWIAPKIEKLNLAKGTQSGLVNVHYEGPFNFLLGDRS